MTLTQAIILGLVQGIGEFLPISSSAHLIIIPELFNFPDPGLTFDIALHLGTLLAILAYFWKDWLIILGLAFRKSSRHTTKDDSVYQKNILWLIVIATIPGAIIGFLLEKQAETIFRNPILIATTLSLAGGLLYFADKTNRHKKDLGNIGKKEALIIGLSQAFAIIPGISRSGATITSSLLLGLDRISAARFSFLMSAPIIFGAVLLKFGDFLRNAGTNEIIGVLVAALSGYIAIAWLMKFIEKVSYKIFFWYRISLAIIIILVTFLMK
jgi:undecaprenyl-diphosphatase